MVNIDPKNPCHYIGSKYEETKDLDIKDLAKLVRTEIKDKVKQGDFPQAKYSVRISRYNFGQSMHVDVTMPYTYKRRKPKAEDELQGSIDDILKQYNYDAGDAMMDYHDSNFIGLINIRYKHERDK